MSGRIAVVLLLSLISAGAFAQPSAEDPFFPVGVWFYWQGKVPDEADKAEAYLGRMLARIRSVGMNVVVADGIVEKNTVRVLDAARQHGMKVILSCRFISQPRRRGKQPLPDEALILKQLQAYLPKVARHPALCLHYTYDCPRMAQSNYLLRVNELVRRLTPNHLTFIACNQTPPEVANGSKAPVITWDNFPIGVNNPPGVLVNYRYSGIIDHERELGRICEKTPDSRHIQLIQAFDSPGRLRLPSPSELRLQINVGFLCGWTDGVLFYRFHSGSGKRPSKGMVDEKLNWQIASAKQLKEICEKTRNIGIRLMGSKRYPPSLLAVPPVLGVAEFQKGDTRYALIVNRSATDKFDGYVIVAGASTRRSTPWQQLASVEDVLTGEKHQVDPKESTRVSVSLLPGGAMLFRYMVADRH